MNLSAETILVADDDPYIQEALQDRLETLGYRVSLAADGQQALQILEHKDPQLILLDIEMPGMKGLERPKRNTPERKRYPRNNDYGLRFHRSSRPGNEGRSL